MQAGALDQVRAGDLSRAEGLDDGVRGKAAAAGAWHAVAVVVGALTEYAYDSPLSRGRSRVRPPGLLQRWVRPGGEAFGIPPGQHQEFFRGEGALEPLGGECLGAGGC